MNEEWNNNNNVVIKLSTNLIQLSGCGSIQQWSLFLIEYIYPAIMQDRIFQCQTCSVRESCSMKLLLKTHDRGLITLSEMIWSWAWQATLLLQFQTIISLLERAKFSHSSRPYHYEDIVALLQQFVAWCLRYEHRKIISKNVVERSSII